MYISQVSGERLQDHWSSAVVFCDEAHFIADHAGLCQWKMGN